MTNDGPRAQHVSKQLAWEHLDIPKESDSKYKATGFFALQPWFGELTETKMDGWMGGRVDGWMDGRTDGRTDIL